ncbi:uncharacterized protein EV422DRAFT_564836 [Fimicolochytrium jonesii]|uniref:uncharacterized protein n=1 Tax=Fimicolochytrium jonesii TaxID=1396493 RepID=UPI0022FE8C3A|nr:uncharacterized protein EV422DRAFT_564836 [Fimicolochytrium jonesii]KAI8824125.1 hypothetical protein EV422DRAFT_564836 [Fimicolochytrium jonesii]
MLASSAPLLEGEEPILDISAVRSPPTRRLKHHHGTASAIAAARENLAVSFLSFPAEVWVEILSNVQEVEHALFFMKTCKAAHSILHPTQRIGQMIWRRLRVRFDWPDPAIAGISDYNMLESYHGRGCHRCPKSPRVRTPQWGWRGVRLCEACFNELTVHWTVLEEEGCGKKRYGKLPSVSGSYLRCMVPSRHPTLEEEVELATRQAAVRDFKKVMANRKGDFALAERRRLWNKAEDRRAEIKAFLQSKYPYLHPHTFPWFDCVKEINGKSTLFTKSVQNQLLRDMEPELVQNRKKLIWAHMGGHMCDLGGSDHIGDKAFTNICDSVAEFVDAERAKELLSDLAARKEKEKRQKKWLQTAIRTPSDDKDLRPLLVAHRLYKVCKAEDEEEYIHYAQQTRTELEAKRQFEVRAHMSKIGGPDAIEKSRTRPMWSCACGFCIKAGANFDSIYEHAAASKKCSIPDIQLSKKGMHYLKQRAASKANQLNPSVPSAEHGSRPVPNANQSNCPVPNPDQGTNSPMPNAKQSNRPMPKVNASQANHAVPKPNHPVPNGNQRNRPAPNGNQERRREHAAPNSHHGSGWERLAPISNQANGRARPAPGPNQGSDWGSFASDAQQGHSQEHPVRNAHHGNSLGNLLWTMSQGYPVPYANQPNPGG